MRVTLAVSLALLLTIPVVFSAGCGDTNAVQGYIDMAQPILDSVAAKYEKLRTFATMPLADRTQMSQTVLEMRKTISQGQEKLDTAHAPASCQDLDSALRTYLDRGRDIADIVTGYADYESELAPVAASTKEIVDLITQLQKENDLGSGLSGLQAKSVAAMNKFRTVMCNSSFDPAHKQFLAFLQTLDVLLSQESGKTSSRSSQRDYNNNNNPESNPYGNDTNPDTQNQSDNQQQQQQKKSTTALSEIPNVWNDVNTQISTSLEALLMSSPFKIKSDEFLAQAQQAVKQLQDLRKKYNYPLKSGKS